MIYNELDNARARVRNALEALTRYVQRPPSVRANSYLFQRLSTELREADEAYRELVGELFSVGSSEAA
jgi:hypothetical protein